MRPVRQAAAAAAATADVAPLSNARNAIFLLNADVVTRSPVIRPIIYLLDNISPTIPGY